MIICNLKPQSRLLAITNKLFKISLHQATQLLTTKTKIKKTYKKRLKSKDGNLRTIHKEIQN